ncbi:MAG: hypothetical protein HYY03_07455 [Chloroflexi bacterium]|nr:hypothetical protein [Chloroflexota bacterium]
MGNEDRRKSSAWRWNLGRPAVRWLLVLALLPAAAVTLAACGGGSDADGSRWPKVLELKEREITPLPLNHQLAVGDDRFIVALEDDENQLVLRADVTLQFFKIEGEEGTLKADMPAEYVGFETSFVHEHEDGTQHTHTGAEIGGYVARFEFDEPGDWGVEIRAQRDGEEFEPLRIRFNVVEKSLSAVPNIGDPAPRSEQFTVRDVDDISEIDSTNPPNPEMHDMTVAEALDTGKPVVVAFTTPAFCTSRTCGPVMDEVVVPLFERYRDRVIFIHIEPYFLKEAREGKGLCVVPVFNLELARQGLAEGPGPCPQLSPEELPPPGESWNLEIEPWVFVIDKQGRIAGKFEGIVGKDEVATVLDEVLGQP